MSVQIKYASILRVFLCFCRSLSLFCFSMGRVVRNKLFDLICITPFEIRTHIICLWCIFSAFLLSLKSILVVRILLTGDQ